MTKVLPLMKEAGVKAHSKLEAKVLIEAKDPDEACDLAIRKMCSDIIQEGKSTRYKEIAQKVREQASVVKVRRSSPRA
jgi:hypothetical protein